MRLHQYMVAVLVAACFWLPTAGLSFAQEQANTEQEVLPVQVEVVEPVIDSNVQVSTETAGTVSSEIPSVISLPSDEEGMVSLDFQDADIRNVLKVLAYKSHMNIVAGPDVTGTVTIQLNNVPWQKALEVLLSTYGYGFEKKGNIITVTTLENLKKRHEQAQLLAEQEPLITRTFILSFAKASEVIDSISKMKTGRGQINFDQRTNALIVRDVEHNVDLISDVIKALDSPTPQVLIEAKIVETGISNTDNLGIDWNVVLGATGGARATTFPFKDTSEVLFLEDDFPGIENEETSNVHSSGKDFVYGTLDATGFSATLQMLSRRNDTRILSNPQIMTLNNQTAKIVVGVQYPLPNYTYNQEQAKLQISGYEYLDIGIIFEVTPHVNNAGLVTMEINPKITEIKELVQVDPSSPARIPQLSTEEAKTKVMIRDGQTLVIAGLIKENTVTDNNKVPFLGDIPLLGKAFFKSKNERKTKTELIVFLTPHIITAHIVDSSNTSSKSQAKP